MKRSFDGADALPKELFCDMENLYLAALLLKEFMWTITEPFR